jgi:hypothetical protein
MSLGSSSRHVRRLYGRIGSRTRRPARSPAQPHRDQRRALSGRPAPKMDRCCRRSDSRASPVSARSTWRAIWALRSALIDPWTSAERVSSVTSASTACRRGSPAPIPARPRGCRDAYVAGRVHTGAVITPAISSAAASVAGCCLLHRQGTTGGAGAADEGDQPGPSGGNYRLGLRAHAEHVERGAVGRRHQLKAPAAVRAATEGQRRPTTRLPPARAIIHRWSQGHTAGSGRTGRRTHRLLTRRDIGEAVRRVGGRRAAPALERRVCPAWRAIDPTKAGSGARLLPLAARGHENGAKAQRGVAESSCRSCCS